MARENKNFDKPLEPLGKTSGGFSLSAPASRRRTARQGSAGNIPSFRRRLSAYQILEAFPDEAREQIPRQIARLNRIVQPYQMWMDNLYKQPYDDFTKWFIVQTSMCLNAPVRKIALLERIKKMKKLSVTGTGREGFITDMDIEKARNVSLTSLIECKRRGGKHWAQCPFHEEKTASMIINENNTAKCFSCQWYGDSIAFVQKTEGLNFIEAVKWLRKQ